MLNSLDAIRNFVQLTPRIGTAGQPSENQFQLIADAGYKTVINIAMPDHPDSIDHEGKLVTELGMNYLHLPVPFDQPKAAISKPRPRKSDDSVNAGSRPGTMASV